jgi:hypothetical protein
LGPSCVKDLKVVPQLCLKGFVNGAQAFLEYSLVPNLHGPPDETEALWVTLQVIISFNGGVDPIDKGIDFAELLVQIHQADRELPPEKGVKFELMRILH